MLSDESSSSHAYLVVGSFAQCISSAEVELKGMGVSKCVRASERHSGGGWHGSDVKPSLGLK